MEQQQQQPRDETLSESASKTLIPRLYYLDNFRSCLTGLVIYHHAAIPYGGIGNASYQSRLHSPGSSPVLSGFNALNQSYFMASFFFLSGYFSTRALQRKDTRSFLKSKAVKLGIPVVVYTLLGAPVIESLTRWSYGQSLDWDILTSYWKTIRGVRGHVWYGATLLLFDALYSIFQSQPENPSERQIGVVLVSNSLLSFLVRLVYPVGVYFAPLRLQPAYLPQYISAYLLGASYNANHPSSSSASMLRGLVTASFTSAAIICGLLIYQPHKYTLNSILGGPNLASFAYSIWNESAGYLLGVLGLQIFRNSQYLNKSWGGIGKYSYAAFLVHMIILTLGHLCTDSWDTSGITKTIVVGSMGVLGSWGLGWVLAKVPYVRQVIS